jgi:CheY-like chemotaxis protein
MPLWHPTHRIHVHPRGDEAEFILDVMAVPGERPGLLRGYTEEEWRAQLDASWTRGADGRWTWRGGSAPFGRLATVTIDDLGDEAPPSRPAQAPRQFLVVDDEERVAQALLRAVRPYARRWCPLVAVDAPDALRQLAQANGHRIHALVSDRRMPGMDGIQLLREAQRLHPRVARILLTGSGAMRDHVVAHRVLRKPCAASMLIAVLDQAVAEIEAGA